MTRYPLDAAAVVISNHHFASASARRIVQRAGIHQLRINYHFISDEQLWRSTVDHLFAQMDTRLPGLGDASSPAP